jgi:hypothetical protein
MRRVVHVGGRVILFELPDELPGLVALPLNARRRGGTSCNCIVCVSIGFDRSMQCCNALHYGVDTACVLFL